MLESLRFYGRMSAYLDSAVDPSRWTAVSVHVTVAFQDATKPHIICMRAYTLGFIFACACICVHFTHASSNGKQGCPTKSGKVRKLARMPQDASKSINPYTYITVSYRFHPHISKLLQFFRCSTRSSPPTGHGCCRCCQHSSSCDNSCIGA
jgi:hypothetical protein